KRLRARLDGLTPVTDAEVQEAQAELARKETARSTAHGAATVAAGRVLLAEQWVRLDADRVRLGEENAGAKARGEKKGRIRADYARLNDLKAAEQVLRQVVTLRGRLSDAPDVLGKLRDEHRRLAESLDWLTAAAEQEKQKEEAHRRQAAEHAQGAEQLRKEAQQKAKFLPTTEAVVKLREDLAGFPPDLADRLNDARTKLKAAAGELTGAGQAKASVAGLLGQAK